MEGRTIPPLPAAESNPVGAPAGGISAVRKDEHRQAEKPLTVKD